ncbi:MAG: M48 family metallopeptidase [Lachnospiraceae bacterium]|nr:M48 family metallopeptidase [Lachnospiraceae bacterium]
MRNSFTIRDNGTIQTIDYTIVRSKRRSIGFEVRPGGKITVRIPMRASVNTVKEIIEDKKDWLYEMYLKQKDKIDTDSLREAERNDPRTAYLEKKYRQAAKRYIYERVEYYIEMIGGHYSSIRIGDQKTRWGSCSNNGTLSFSWRLMLAPPRVLDYVVIHEICHLTYMDHSKNFWDLVSVYDPDYKEHRKWLKENGDSLILS